MAIIRKVAVHENSRMWAYIEYPMSDPSKVTILGGKEFSTKPEAEDWSKGFAIDSYEHVEPIELKKQRLLGDKQRYLDKIAKIDIELQNI